MILDNLLKAGVKGTDKSQRITLARLDPFPGEYIHAEGETDTGTAVRVCIGPEFGTFGDVDIK
jgi:adenine-specific DNA-methyltransferase